MNYTILSSISLFFAANVLAANLAIQNGKLINTLDANSNSISNVIDIVGTNGASLLVVSNQSYGCLMLTTNHSLTINTATNQWTQWQFTNTYNGITFGSNGLTNAAAGTYRVSLDASFGVTTAANIRGFIYTNGVSTGIKFTKTVPITADYNTASTFGYVTLPTNTHVTAYIGTTASEDVTMEYIALELRFLY